MLLFYGWWIVFACFVISLYVSSVIFFGFTAFFEPIVKEFGWSYAQVSLATSLRGLEMGIFAPVLGFLVDHYGARKLLFLGHICLNINKLTLVRPRAKIGLYAEGELDVFADHQVSFARVRLCFIVFTLPRKKHQLQ